MDNCPIYIKAQSAMGQTEIQLQESAQPGRAAQGLIDWFMRASDELLDVAPDQPVRKQRQTEDDAQASA